jgi:predicted Zn-ribbon and HTH transcriptional regulator
VGTVPSCDHLAPAEPRPPDSPWEVADIFRLYGDTYMQTLPVSPAQHKVIRAIMACRTATLGGHAEQCLQCGFERYAYNSCRNRHCPKCQTVPKAKWVEARQTELLTTPYFHTVWTLPHELNPLILGNQRLLLSLLFRSASETLRQFGRQNLGGQLGAIMVLHTWDQVLKAHFHLHALVPGGALVSDGARWAPTHPNFLFPVKALGKVFRGKFLDALQQPRIAQALTFTEHAQPLSTPEGFAQLLDQLYDKDWIVYAKRPFKGPKQVLDYIGRYTHRVAIANHRIVDGHNGQVRFTFRHRRQGDQLQSMALPAHTFIHRFLLHVLPSGFVRIRHYGFLANRCKAQALPRCRQALGQGAQPPEPAPTTVAQWMLQYMGIDLTRCPQCGHQPLVRTPVPPQTTSSWIRAPPT